jgi:hypothetical protein
VVVSADLERPFAAPAEPDFDRWSRSHVLAVARGDRTDPDCLAEIRRAEAAGVDDPWLVRAVATGDRPWGRRQLPDFDEPDELAAAYASGAIG